MMSEKEDGTETLGALLGSVAVSVFHQLLRGASGPRLVGAGLSGFSSHSGHETHLHPCVSGFIGANFSCCTLH